jgi:rSAM/selenodomain-associated transferase 1
MYNRSSKKNKTDSLIIFLRYPQNGKVKSRLAKTTSSEFALDFYKSCAENIIRQVKSIPKINHFAFYSDKAAKDKITKWLGGKLFFSPQEGNDLGDKMKNAFEKVFSTGAEKVIIIGTDVPDLSKEIIQNAFKSLDNSDVVIGPSRDGGYYLLGMKRMNPNLFEGIEFSTSSVYKNTVEKFSKLNLSYYVLPELQDIDTEEDLIHWLKSNSINSIKETIKLAYEGI